MLKKIREIKAEAERAGVSQKGDWLLIFLVPGAVWLAALLLEALLGATPV